mmetsp:Transcript_4534/g.15069  ORF Transcript_4534/g.15069 Transcript_4534/m.15069 type:complete len:213 (-) Transcript_4534:48-686(-)
MPERLESAVLFLKAVKAEFCEAPLVYKALCSCLVDFGKSQNAADTNEKAGALLAGSPQLLDHFRAFFRHAGAGGSRTEPIVVDDDDENDDDVVIVGHSGVNANQDLAHARHDCAVCLFPHRRTPDRDARAQAHCPRCHCFLCDAPVAECARWDLHAVAHDKDPQWKAIRDALKQLRGAQHHPRHHENPPPSHASASTRHQENDRPAKRQRPW